jgi:hypothetical protein
VLTRPPAESGIAVLRHRREDMNVEMRVELGTVKMESGVYTVGVTLYRKSSGEVYQSPALANFDLKITREQAMTILANPDRWPLVSTAAITLPDPPTPAGLGEGTGVHAGTDSGSGEP